MATRFDPAGPLRGELVAPPDKSISHRAALLAGFGEGRTAITRFLDSDDTRSTLGAVEALGATVSIGTARRWRNGRRGRWVRPARRQGPPGPIDVGNAGTLIRLLSGLLAGQRGRSFELDGDDSIRAADGPGARAAGEDGRRCRGC